MAVTRNWRTRGLGWTLIPMVVAGGSMTVGLSAGQAPPAAVGAASDPDESAGGFRQFPGGRIVAELRAGLAPRLTAAALRADADRDLPDGLRLRDDGEPSVAPIGANRLFRFGLDYRGIPLTAESTYVAIVSRSGRLLSSRLQRVPLAVDASVPTVVAATAVAAATGHARGALGQAGPLATTAPSLAVWVDEARQGHLTWSFTVTEGTPDRVTATTQYLVAAVDTPTVLAWTDAIRYDGVHTQVELWDLSPKLSTVTAPLASARVVFNGAIVTTDQDGNLVGVTNTAGGSVTVSGLQGPFARVTTAVQPTFAASVTTAGGDETISVAAATENARAQATAFVWTTYANRWVRERLPFLNTTPTVLNNLLVVVNENIPCNAFSTGNSIHFGRATSACSNTATPTIVLHEFGHSLHAALSHGTFSGDFSEGFGDALAALITRQPCHGVGALIASDDCLRDARTVTTWPVASGEVHEVGQTYAQFMWVLAETIDFDAATEIMLATAMAGPADVPDAVRLGFVADDDDGLLGTCSPHQRALEAAADSRLLPRPPNCRPAGDNQAPTAHDDLLIFVEDEDARVVDLVGNDSDPDGDPLIVSTVQAGTLGTFDCTPMPCRYRPRSDASGTEVLLYTVIDTYGGQATAAVRIQIAPVEDPLSVSGLGDIAGLEDEAIPVGASVVDPDGPAFTLRWFAGSAAAPAPCAFAAPSAASTTVTCTHEGSFPIGVVVTQGATDSVWPLGTVSVANTHPSVVITAPLTGATFAESISVAVAAVFDDGPTPGPHTCQIAWGDGTTTAGAVGAGSCAGTHVYAAGSAGPRQIVVSVLDPGLARGTAFVSIAITSAPPATCVRRPGQTCTAAGIGTVGRQPAVAFEFTVGLRGTQPIGQMLLLDGTWRFLTVAIRSLAIPGDQATFTGTGSVNGRPGYTFDATVVDNRRLLGRSARPDTLRVVVRDAAGTVVRVIDGELTRGDLVVD